MSKDIESYIEPQYRPPNCHFGDPHNLAAPPVESWILHLSSRQLNDSADVFRFSSVLPRSKGRVPAQYDMVKAPKSYMVPIMATEKAMKKERAGSSRSTSMASTPAPSLPPSVPTTPAPVRSTPSTPASLNPANLRRGKKTGKEKLSEIAKGKQRIQKKVLKDVDEYEEDEALSSSNDSLREAHSGDEAKDLDYYDEQDATPLSPLSPVESIPEGVSPSMVDEPPSVALNDSDLRHVWLSSAIGLSQFQECIDVLDVKVRNSV